MNVSSVPQLVIRWKPEVQNKRGRPRERLKDKLLRDIAENGKDEQNIQGQRD